VRATIDALQQLVSAETMQERRSKQQEAGA
jgi:ribosomal protein S5